MTHRLDIPPDSESTVPVLIDRDDTRADGGFAGS